MLLFRRPASLFLSLVVVAVAAKADSQAGNISASGGTDIYTNLLKCEEQFSTMANAADDSNACAQCLLEPVAADTLQSCDDDCAPSSTARNGVLIPGGNLSAECREQVSALSWKAVDKSACRKCLLEQSFEHDDEARHLSCDVECADALDESAGTSRAALVSLETILLLLIPQVTMLMV